MTEQNRLSRRGFVKSVAATAGAAALPSVVSAQGAAPQTVAVAPPLSLRNVSQFPGLTPRGAGWLRLVWEKATTRDDWSSAGIPHPWWDRYTAPVVLSYGRFDLSYSDDPTVVRHGRDVEQLSRPQFDHATIVERRSCGSRQDQADMLDFTAGRPDRRSRVNGPLPPWLIGGSANRDRTARV